MKLIIDRAQTTKNIYSIEFGIDFDVLIGRWEINVLTTKPDELSEVDRIITKSAELKYCVMYMKHPLLLKNYGDGDPTSSKAFRFQLEDYSYRAKLRNYFALRLTHRRRPVDLYEFGKRLFS